MINHLLKLKFKHSSFKSWFAGSRPSFDLMSDEGSWQFSFSDNDREILLMRSRFSSLSLETFVSVSASKHLSTSDDSWSKSGLRARDAYTISSSLSLLSSNIDRTSSAFSSICSSAFSLDLLNGGTNGLFSWHDSTSQSDDLQTTWSSCLSLACFAVDKRDIYCCRAEWTVSSRFFESIARTWAAWSMPRMCSPATIVSLYCWDNFIALINSAISELSVRWDNSI